MHMQQIGTCDQCGGPVFRSTADFGGTQPVPECGHCGAKQANPWPVIKMVPRPAPAPCRPSEYRSCPACGRITRHEITYGNFFTLYACAECHTTLVGNIQTPKET